MKNRQTLLSDFNNVCVFFTLYLDNTQIATVKCGMTYPSNRYRVVQKKRSGYMFEYVISGNGYVEYNGQKIPVSEGDTLCFKKNSSYIQYSDSKNPYNKIWVEIWGEIVDTLLPHYNFSNDVYVLKANTHDILSELHDAVHTNADFEALTLLVHKLILRMYKSTSTQYPKQNELAKAIKDYIDANIQTNMHLEDVATLFFISKIQLIRLFKKAYNVTPYAYILDAKIRVARSMLITTNLSIKEIATQLSFTDEHYFTNSFRRYTGMPPGEFRKKYISSQKRKKD